MEASSGTGNDSPTAGKGKIASGYVLRLRPVVPRRRKRRSVQRSCGLSFSLQALSATRSSVSSETLLSEKDKVDIDENPEVEALGADFWRKEDLVRVLSSLAVIQGSGRIALGKGFDVKNEAALHNFYSNEYKEGFLGRVGSDPRGSAVMVLPSTQKSEFRHSVSESFGNRENSEYFFKKDDDGTVGQISVGFPNLILEATVSQGVLRVPNRSEFQIEGISLENGKSARCLKVSGYKSILQEEEQMFQRFLFGLSQVVDGSEQFWLSAVYGPNSTTLRKDFWVELSDIFGLSSPLVCGRFQCHKEMFKKLGGASLTPSMKDLDDFIRENELRSSFKESIIHLVKHARASRARD
ncbi:hypothetical protein CK203_046139 [Vitis vinifera]|uniref:Uncharacterized protein n=1 Tax=Vitis vinifera TaxID=29760 RepID=A0A438I494_VITVI|nr:hypothetical protein CK203_046139 [Vitis vinifera]